MDKESWINGFVTALCAGYRTDNGWDEDEARAEAARLWEILQKPVEYQVLSDPRAILQFLE